MRSLELLGQFERVAFMASCVHKIRLSKPNAAEIEIDLSDFAYTGLEGFGPNLILDAEKDSHAICAEKPLATCALQAEKPGCCPSIVAPFECHRGVWTNQRDPRPKRSLD